MKGFIACMLSLLLLVAVVFCMFIGGGFFVAILLPVTHLVGSFIFLGVFILLGSIIAWLFNAEEKEMK